MKKISFCIKNCGETVSKKGNMCRQCFRRYFSEKQKGENNTCFRHGGNVDGNYTNQCCIVEGCNEKVYQKGNKCKKHSSMYLSSIFKDKKHKEGCFCAYCSSQKGKSNPFYNKHHSEETKKIIGLANLGKIVSKETRKKLSISSGGTGIPYEYSEYGAEFDNALKEQVRMRDKYTCQLCGCSQVENGKQLDVHHIDYDKKNNNINNLIALCIKCHRKTNYNRNNWVKIINGERNE